MKADLIKAARSAADALDDAAFLSKCDAQREPPSIGGDEKKTPGPKSGRPTLKHHITVARHHPGEACRATTARHGDYSISLTSVNGAQTKKVGGRAADKHRAHDQTRGRRAFTGRSPMPAASAAVWFAVSAVATAVASADFDALIREQFGVAT